MVTQTVVFVVQGVNTQHVENAVPQTRGTAAVGPVTVLAIFRTAAVGANCSIGDFGLKVDLRRSADLYSLTPWNNAAFFAGAFPVIHRFDGFLGGFNKSEQLQIIG